MNVLHKGLLLQDWVFRLGSDPFGLAFWSRIFPSFSDELMQKPSPCVIEAVEALLASPKGYSRAI